MVFSCSNIQFSVIYAHSPTCNSSGRNQLILLIFYDSCSSHIRYHMNMTHACIVGYKVNKTHIQQLHNLFSNNFFHIRVESSLRMDNRFLIIFHQYLLHANCGTNTFQIFNGPSDSTLVFLEHFDELVFLNFF